jgi:hypothetical protein
MYVCMCVLIVTPYTVGDEHCPAYPTDKQVKGSVSISPRMKLSRGQYVEADDAHIGFGISPITYPVFSPYEPMV